VAGDEGSSDLGIGVEVCKGGREVWSYGMVEEEYEPRRLVRNMDKAAEGAILLVLTKYANPEYLLPSPTLVICLHVIFQDS
jgi:hypothetical protein